MPTVKNWFSPFVDVESGCSKGRNCCIHFPSAFFFPFLPRKDVHACCQIVLLNPAPCECYDGLGNGIEHVEGTRGFYTGEGTVAVGCFHGFCIFFLLLRYLVLILMSELYVGPLFASTIIVTK